MTWIRSRRPRHAPRSDRPAPPDATRARWPLAVLLTAVTGCTAAPAAEDAPREAPVATEADSGPYVHATDLVAAGEYLSVVGGCNDCHTPGWDTTMGDVPSDDRLTGSPVGFRGPWGTSYPANLRLSVQSHSSADWIAMVRARTGSPPMPWMNLHQMRDRDLRAIYTYIRHLGPKGEPAPALVPPGQEPATPYILMVPQGPGAEGIAGL